MTNKKFALDVKAAVLCDDVRKEANGKDIIIGAYTGQITVGGFPAHFPFSLWLILSMKQMGKFKLEIEIRGTSDARISSMETNIEVTGDDNYAGITLGPFMTELQQEGNITARARLDEGAWHEIFKMPVTVAT